MNKKQKTNLIRIIITIVLLLALTIIFKKVEVEWYIELIAYIVPYAVIGYEIIRKSIKNIFKGNFLDENFLMAVATIGAFVLGDYKEGVAVMLFFQIGELFESYAVNKSRRNISELMDIRPDYANIVVLQDNLEQIQDEHEDATIGDVVRIDPDEVEVGSVIEVKPGEKIPIDGVIVEGESVLDTAALTGESKPVNVGVGAEVLSGSINMSGVIRIETTTEFDESTASKILDLVENASSKKSKSENFISKFAKYYTPIVCGIAVALAIIPPVIMGLMGNGYEFGVWVYRALTFLVISCPCALVISVPLSFFAGIGAASSKGVLIKGSNYLEMLSKIDTVLFDKTGTLTKGNFAVTKICALESNVNSNAKDELLRLAAATEGYSSHPIALSLRNAYQDIAGNDKLSEANDLEEISGHGIVARIEDKKVAVGNVKLMDKLNISYDKADEVGTIVYVAIDDKFAGYIVINDEIKDESQDAIETLYKAGIKNVGMLTGDETAIAEEIGKKLNLSNVYSRLLPADKVSVVEENLAQNKKVAFVGDGINDAPVLMRSDVGISMGALGSDAAIEASDVVLMDDNPKNVSLAIRISKKCMRIVYENIYFAIGIKLICLILGAVGIANMWVAIFADVGVMVIAVLNAIRCLRVKKN